MLDDLDPLMERLGVKERVSLPVRTGKFRERAFGIYNFDSQIIRLKRAFDLATFTHELGHHIDFALFEKHGRPAGLFKAELLQLGKATTPASKIGRDIHGIRVAGSVWGLTRFIT